MSFRASENSLVQICRTCTRIDRGAVMLSIVVNTSTNSGLITSSPIRLLHNACDSIDSNVTGRRNNFLLPFLLIRASQVRNRTSTSRRRRELSLKKLPALGGLFLVDLPSIFFKDLGSVPLKEEKGFQHRPNIGVSPMFV